MITAGGYGNAGAYFTSGGSSNVATRYILGLDGSLGGGRNRVSPYSVIRFPANDGALSTANRIASPSSAIIGWHGPRPVAFPMVEGWNFDTPLT